MWCVLSVLSLWNGFFIKKIWQLQIFFITLHTKIVRERIKSFNNYI